MEKFPPLDKDILFPLLLNLVFPVPPLIDIVNGYYYGLEFPAILYKPKVVSYFTRHRDYGTDHHIVSKDFLRVEYIGFEPSYPFTRNTLRIDYAARTVCISMKLPSQLKMKLHNNTAKEKKTETTMEIIEMKNPNLVLEGECRFGFLKEVVWDVCFDGIPLYAPLNFVLWKRVDDHCNDANDYSDDDDHILDNDIFVLPVHQGRIMIQKQKEEDQKESDLWNLQFEAQKNNQKKNNKIKRKKTHLPHRNVFNRENYQRIFFKSIFLEFTLSKLSFHILSMLSM